MPDFAIEEELRREGYICPAGVDEAGRGPLAGPVVAAAVILPPSLPAGIRLDDSKKLSPELREKAFAAIRLLAVSWCAAVAQADEIDRRNILQATLGAMSKAVNGLNPPADFVLVDGNQLPQLPVPGRALVRGDARSLSVAAASVLAKVIRDRIMGVYGRRFPQWGFERHKGYGTKLHLEALARHGASPIHRLTFRPLRPQ